MDDTIVAVATAAAGAGRGILRLSGPAVVACLRDCFLPEEAGAFDRKLPWCSTGRLQVAPPIQQIPGLLYLWPGVRSYTRQPTAEIHTLGSPPLLEAGLQALCQSGARLANPGEFTLRSFLAGRLDLTQAEAVLGVIDAANQRQLEMALTQLAGGLSVQFRDAQNRLLNLCADVEAGLDFVDEDIEFVSPAEILRQLTGILQQLKNTLQQMESRAAQNTDRRVVLFGRPNVGKSTLWNRLLGHSSALVSPTPGTTRDYLEDRLQLGELSCLLVDTAGQEEHQAISETDGAAQRIAQRNRNDADLVVLCLDPNRPITPWEWLQLTDDDRPPLAVVTKIDDPAVDLSTWIGSFPAEVAVENRPSVIHLRPVGIGAGYPLELLKVSGLTEFGLTALRSRVAERLLEQDAVENGIVECTATRCRESLRRTCESIEAAQALVDSSAGEELVAIELRSALDELGQVLGTVYTEDILDRIFGRFCIGK